MNDPVNERFKTLIQPIRDLAQNWDIDVAEELNEYLEQLCRVDSYADLKGLNFAEAALLIQGSATVYSKKVEYLHQLVLQALELFSNQKVTDKATGTGANNGSNKQATTTSVIDDDIIFFNNDDQFLLLDDFIEEGGVITLDAQKEKQLTKDRRRSSAGRMSMSADTSRASMILMHSILQEDHGSSSLKLSSCRVDANGALMMSGIFGNAASSSSGGIGNISMISHIESRDVNGSRFGYDTNQSFGGFGDDDGGWEPDMGNDAPLQNNSAFPVVYPTTNVFQPLNAALPLPPTENLAVLAGRSSPPNLRSREATQPATVTNNIAAPPTRSSKLLDLLDSHESLTTSKPISKGKTFRIPPNLPPLGARTARSSQQQRTTASSHSNDFQSILEGRFTLHDTIQSIFQPIARKQRAIVSSKRFQDRLNARRSVPIQTENNEVNANLPPAADSWGYDDCDDDNFYGGDDNMDFGTNPVREDHMPANFVNDNNDHGFEPDFGQQEFIGDGGYDMVPQGNEEQETEEDWIARRVEQALSEDLVLSQGVTYESLCRKHIDSFMLGAERYARETQLSKRVSEWTKRLEPYLRAQEEAQPFDIHSYSDQLLTTVKEVSELSIDERRQSSVFPHENVKESEVHFDEIAHGKDASEVCRMFLACLQLANLGNVTISDDVDNGGQQKFSFVVKLNRISSRLEDIENYRAPSSMGEIVAGAGASASEAGQGVLQDIVPKLGRKPSRIKKAPSVNRSGDNLVNGQDVPEDENHSLEVGKAATKRSHSQRSKPLSNSAGEASIL